MNRAGIVYHGSKRTDTAVRNGALWYAALWVIGSVMVALGLGSRPQSFIGLAGLCVLGAGWLLVAWWHYRLKLSTPRTVIGGLVAYHIFSALYIVWVVGAQHPVVYSWALLIAVAGMRFGGRGGGISSLVFFVALLIAWQQGAPVSMLLGCFLSVVTIGSVASYVIRQTQQDQHDLDESHRQARLQRDRTTTLINNLTDAVLSTDQNGTIVMYNAATLNLLDTNSDLDGKNIDDVLQLRDSDGVHLTLSDELYDARTAVVRDDLVTLISGEAMRLEVAYSPIRRSYDEDADDGEIGGFIIIVRDITTAKSLEEERDEFISVVSHELRTPITIAEGTVSNAQIMLGRRDIPSEKIVAAIDMAHEQIVFLARMVNDLSTLSRAERGVADEAEDIDVNELIKGIHREYNDEAAAKDLDFDLHAPANVGVVHVSRLYLKELLQNFVTNAIKYTSNGTITLEVARTSDDTVEFAVKDTGIGISYADQKRLFEKFYRAEDYRTRESSGTGLGLYVAAKLARKLDTSIEMKSRLNHGSRFSIKLPLVKPAKKPKKP